MLKKLVAAASLLTIVSCAKPEVTSETKNVFGNDDRQAMTASNALTRKIGLIEFVSNTGSNKICTGSFVWHNLILTNAHCIFNSDGTFVKNFRMTVDGKHSSRKTYYANHAWWGTKKPQSERHKDWAIIKTTESSPYYFGYSIHKPAGNKLHLVGFSGDFYNRTGYAGAHTNCYIRGEEHGYYLHDCDMMGGASGGPMFAKGGDSWIIHGLNAAEYYCGGRNKCPVGVKYSRSNANLAVKVSAFSRKIAELRKQFPKK